MTSAPKAAGAVRLPVMPMISRAVLDFGRCTLRDGDDGAYRWFAGEIKVGEIFAWEPDLPYARELCLVTRVINMPGDECRIYTRPIDGPAPNKLPTLPHVLETWNDESRFREAAVPTIMRPWPVERAA